MTDLNLGWNRFLQEDDDVVASSQANTLAGLPMWSGTSTENKVSEKFCLSVRMVRSLVGVLTCFPPLVRSLLLHRMIFVKD